jgi:hypothetical protein
MERRITALLLLGIVDLGCARQEHPAVTEAPSRHIVNKPVSPEITAEKSSLMAAEKVLLGSAELLSGIPGKGPLSISEISVWLGGAIVGGITGGFIGAMAGWGVHEHQIQHYERLLKSGSVLIVANGNPTELAYGYRHLQDTNASELHLYARSDDEASGVIGHFERRPSMRP